MSHHRDRKIRRATLSEEKKLNERLITLFKKIVCHVDTYDPYLLESIIGSNKIFSKTEMKLIQKELGFILGLPITKED